MCFTLAGATPAPVIRSAALSIQGMNAVGSPPAGSSWAPQPVTKRGLRLAAVAGNGWFALHNACGDRTFPPGVNPGSTPQPRSRLKQGTGQFRDAALDSVRGFPAILELWLAQTRTEQSKGQPQLQDRGELQRLTGATQEVESRRKVPAATVGA